MSEQTLKDEVVVITGASGGIGEATARDVARKGGKVILVARREAKLRELANSLETESFVIAEDVRNTEQLLEKIDNAPAPFNQPTVLINNAGLAIGRGKAYEADPDDWDVMIDTNIRALIRLTRGLLPKMIAQNKGYIVQLGSVAGNWPYPGGHVYCGTKAFVRQFSLALRSDLLGTPIRVTVIEPGLVETDFFETRFKGDKDAAAKVFEDFQALEAEDIARTVVWCLEQPPHVNITSLEVMSTQQSYAGFLCERNKHK